MFGNNTHINDKGGYRWCLNRRLCCEKFIFFFNRAKNEAGFTLIEMIVALGVFIVVVFILFSSLLSIFAVSQKIQSSRSIMDNLNLAMEDIARNMRTGLDYHCGDTGDLTAPQDCAASGDTFIAFVDQNNILIAFRFVESGGQGRIERSQSCLPGGCSNWQSLTAPEIDVDTFQIFVRGAVFGDGEQPQAFLIVRGTAGVRVKERVAFDLQTTVSQRVFDS